MALSRHPRYLFTIVLFILTTIYVLSLSYHSTPLPATVAWGASGLADRMERAELIYNKVLLDRQGLIHKFGPTPNDVLMWVIPLCVFFGILTLWALGFLQTRSLGQRIQLVGCHAGAWPHRPWLVALGDFFPPAFNCPHELERLGALGDGGKWLCGLSRLKEKEDCIVYSFGKQNIRITTTHF